MILYVKEILDHRIGDNTPFKDIADSLGWKITIDESQTEKDRDGFLWEKGYAKSKPIDLVVQKVKQQRKAYLNETDKLVSIPDFPITEEEKKLAIKYRDYLRKLPESDTFPDSGVMRFEEWKEKNKNV